MLKRIINKILFSIYGEDVLITKEGWSYLNDPIKRVKLREWIELYHKTGVWDYSFWEESKHEELNQSDVIKNEVAVCHCGNESVEEYHPSCSLKCTLCKHEETENLYCNVGWLIEGKRCKKCKQTVL